MISLEDQGGHSPQEASARSTPIAVIDLGSNTARVVVFRVDAAGSFQVVADDKVALRLIHQIDDQGRLRPEACERILRVLGDFRRIAAGAGAGTIVTVATAAMREALNGPDLLARARRATGLTVRLLSADAEARCAFLGAIYGMAVEDGMVLDIGGGSLQTAYFKNRSLQSSWSLPLGALRLSTRFLSGDPPTKREIKRLRDFAAKALVRAELPRLGRNAALIGTGGTIRNLGKIDARLRGYPITRLHGYVLSAGRTRAMNALFAGRSTEARMAIPGLNASRADSIVGGGLLVETLMEHVHAGKMVVAGHGLREGLILEELGLDSPFPASTRRGVQALVSRFTCWDAARAERRKKIAQVLSAALLPPDRAFEREMIALAAEVLDIGRSVEYYRRHEHAAMILRSAGLNGFGHREILYLSLIIEVAESIDAKGRTFKPLLRNGDLEEITRSAIVLSLADEIEHRIPERRAPRTQCRVVGKSVLISEPALADWEPASIVNAVQRWFGKELRVSG